MNKVLTSLALLLLLAFPALAADPTEKDATELVAKAVKYIEANGQEKAFKAFEDKAGGFTNGELYVFVYNTDGVCVSHGANAKLIGKNRLDVEDVNGKKYIQEIVDLAKSKGTGWVDYLFKNPESGKIEPKTTHLQLVKGTNLIVCCGIYKAK